MYKFTQRQILALSVDATTIAPNAFLFALL